MLAQLIEGMLQREEQLAGAFDLFYYELVTRTRAFWRTWRVSSCPMPILFEEWCEWYHILEVYYELSGRGRFPGYTGEYPLLCLLKKPILGDMPPQEEQRAPVEQDSYEQCCN